MVMGMRAKSAHADQLINEDAVLAKGDQRRPMRRSYHEGLPGDTPLYARLFRPVDVAMRLPKYRFASSSRRTPSIFMEVQATQQLDLLRLYPRMVPFGDTLLAVFFAAVFPAL